MVRTALMAFVLLAAVGTGCTLTPIYGDASRAGATMVSFSYAEPSSRLEQVIYQELSLRFARSEAPGTPELTVSVYKSAGDLGSNVQVTVTAVASVTRDGAVIYSGTRKAAALYVEGAQELANVSARTEAEERAAKSAAESLRLALLAQFAGGITP